MYIWYSPAPTKRRESPPHPPHPFKLKRKKQLTLVLLGVRSKLELHGSAVAEPVPPVVLLQLSLHDLRVVADSFVQVRRSALGHAGHIEVREAEQLPLVYGVSVPARVLTLLQQLSRLLKPHAGWAVNWLETEAGG